MLTPIEAAGAPDDAEKFDIVNQPAPQQPSVASSPKPITSPAEAVNVTVPDCGSVPRASALLVNGTDSPLI